jgi:dTDP-glucose pyrophosphorylase
MLAGIARSCCLPRPNTDSYRRLFGVAKLGMSIEYIVQPRRAGRAYHLDADFVGTQPNALILATTSSMARAQ